MGRSTIATSVAAGGLIGAFLRWSVGELLGPAAGFPFATFVVNLIGCLLLGFVAGHPSNGVRKAIGSGFCGGLTTFSTLALEVVQLADTGDAALAFGYVVASAGTGLVAIQVGRRSGRRRGWVVT